MEKEQTRIMPRIRSEDNFDRDKRRYKDNYLALPSTQYIYIFILPVPPSGKNAERCKIVDS